MTKASARLSLKEFKELSGVPDTLLVWLLVHNKLPCESGPSGLQVVLSPQVLGDLQSALCVPWRELLAADYRLYVEKIARVISEELEPFFEEALAIASRRTQG